MIVQTVNEYDFLNAFTSIRPDNFSREALFAMYEAFEEYSDDSGIPFDLDVIGVCCEYSEFESLEELKASYTDIESLGDLHDRTMVIELDNGGLVIQDF